ncbi:OstA-like protein [Dysgonomonas sp. 25]|uniref:OstA-like protein n=1 Tax=Dysgonomonas sp. 25 TaxID=2302933 RepID=UPI00351B91E4
MINRIFKYLKQRHRIPALGVLCLIAIYASGQTYLSSRAKLPVFPQEELYMEVQAPDTVAPAKQTDQSRVIIIKHAKKLDNSSARNPDINVLLDSVILTHAGASLFADSVYLYEQSNKMEAYNNVRMEQGDTLFLYGDFMDYNGNTSIVKVRDNVRLENSSVTLYTDSLNYDRNLNMGYYFDGGMLVDEENELTSNWGQYEPDNKRALFRDNVKVVNAKFTLESDSLEYYTETKIVKIVSPTRIVSDSGVIHTSNGWYNTVTEESVLLDQSTVYSNQGDKILRGDSIVYHKGKGYGEVFGNMFMQDTVRKVILRGHYGYFNDSTEYAFATDSAYAIEYSEKDSLFLHANILELEKDSIYRVMKAYHEVRFYRRDLQGVCDSMQFNSRDSVLHLFREPVLWHESNQISGDTIDVFMNDSTIDYIHVKRYSFSIERKDSLMYNQMKGRSMKAYMANGKIKRIFIDGNAESIYYPEEDDGTVLGLNHMTSGYFEVIFNDETKLEKMKAWPEPVAKLSPPDLILDSERRLPDFVWLDYLRPKDKMDIFRKVKKRAEDIKEHKSIIPDNFEFPVEFE